MKPAVGDSGTRQCLESALKNRSVVPISQKEVVAKHSFPSSLTTMGGESMETITGRKFRPKWVTGLRPRLEKIMKEGIRRGSLIGRGRIISDMLEVTALVFTEEETNAGVRVNGRKVEFTYPVKGNETFGEIYYPLVGMLSNL